MSKFLILSLSILAAVITTGCALHSPGSHAELCSQLRSQYVYNSIDTNITAVTTTRYQKQELIDKLKANNCPM